MEKWPGTSLAFPPSEGGSHRTGKTGEAKRWQSACSSDSPWQSYAINWGVTKARGDEHARTSMTSTSHNQDGRGGFNCCSIGQRCWLVSNGNWAEKKKGKTEGIAERLCRDARRREPASWVLCPSGHLPQRGVRSRSGSSGFLKLTGSATVTKGICC